MPVKLKRVHCIYSISIIQKRYPDPKSCYPCRHLRYRYRYRPRSIACSRSVLWRLLKSIACRGPYAVYDAPSFYPASCVSCRGSISHRSPRSRGSPASGRFRGAHPSTKDHLSTSERNFQKHFAGCLENIAGNCWTAPTRSSFPSPGEGSRRKDRGSTTSTSRRLSRCGIYHRASSSAKLAFLCSTEKAAGFCDRRTETDRPSKTPGFFPGITRKVTQWCR